MLGILYTFLCMGALKADMGCMGILQGYIGFSDPLYFFQGGKGFFFYSCKKDFFSKGNVG